jgi:hypothetical protein
LCEKLQIKLRNYKKQVEDAEEIAALNLVRAFFVNLSIETFFFF